MGSVKGEVQRGTVRAARRDNRRGAPRQANYHFQYANGSLTNTGNATLRILAYGPCLKAANGKECKENYYLMPGKSRRFTRVDTADNKGRVALWQGDKFIPVK